jgi:hypothetical protein
MTTIIVLLVLIVLFSSAFGALSAYIYLTNKELPPSSDLDKVTVDSDIGGMV